MVALPAAQPWAPPDPWRRHGPTPAQGPIAGPYPAERTPEPTAQPGATRPDGMIKFQRQQVGASVP
eukprot:5011248-Alexandrium_andersonii.AAC.1